LEFSQAARFGWPNWDSSSEIYAALERSQLFTHFNTNKYNWNQKFSFGMLIWKKASWNAVLYFWNAYALMLEIY